MITGMPGFGANAPRIPRRTAQPISGLAEFLSQTATLHPLERSRYGDIGARLRTAHPIPLG